MKKLIKWLQMWEGIWLVPLLFAGVIGISNILLAVWGPSAGLFPPGLINGAIIAGFYMFVGTSLVNLMLNLYHRGWFRYYYGQVHDHKQHSKKDINSIPAWLRILFLPLLGLVYFIIYCWLVSQLM